MKLEWQKHEDDGHIWYTLEIPGVGVMDLVPPQGRKPDYQWNIYLGCADNPARSGSYPGKELPEFATYWATSAFISFLLAERTKTRNAIVALSEMDRFPRRKPVP